MTILAATPHVYDRSEEVLLSFIRSSVIGLDVLDKYIVFVAFPAGHWLHWAFVLLRLIQQTRKFLRHCLGAQDIQLTEIHFLWQVSDHVQTWLWPRLRQTD